MSYIYSNCSLQMSSNIEWLQALRCLCGLQLLLFDVDVELLLLSSCDRQHLVCESEVCLNHFGDLVLAWIALLNLVPIRLGFVGIGFSNVSSLDKMGVYIIKFGAFVVVEGG